MSYLSFLAVFLLIPVAILTFFLFRSLRSFHLKAGAIICLVAFGYTSPWDNYAAARHLWSFDPHFVLGRPFWLGTLPMEEYLFYFCQALFVCLAMIALGRIRWLTPEEEPLHSPLVRK